MHVNIAAEYELVKVTIIININFWQLKYILEKHRSYTSTKFHFSLTQIGSSDEIGMVFNRIISTCEMAHRFFTDQLQIRCENSWWTKLYNHSFSTYFRVIEHFNRLFRQKIKHTETFQCSMIHHISEYRKIRFIKISSAINMNRLKKYF